MTMKEHIVYAGRGKKIAQKKVEQVRKGGKGYKAGYFARLEISKDTKGKIYYVVWARKI